MKIVVISPKYSSDNEQQNIIKLFESGLQSFHLNKPLYKFNQLKEYIDGIPKEFHDRIIIHTHHKLITEYNLQGVHYTRMHFEPTLKNWWQNKRLSPFTENMVKTATHRKLAALYEKSDIPLDYVFLNPVFDTITGKIQSEFHEDLIRKANARQGLKVIAQGGIDTRRIEQVSKLGFFGMALNNFLWSRENPVEEYKKFISRCEELQIRTI
ncbi:MAG: thiamine phosphate synthase [Bacteroidia bacterium]